MGSFQRLKIKCKYIYFCVKIIKYQYIYDEVTLGYLIAVHYMYR